MNFSSKKSKDEAKKRFLSEEKIAYFQAKRFLFEKKEFPVKKNILEKPIPPPSSLSEKDLPKVTTRVKELTSLIPNKLSKFSIQFIVLQQLLYNHEIIYQIKNQSSNSLIDQTKITQLIEQDTFLQENMLKKHAIEIQSLLEKLEAILLEKEKLDQGFIPFLQNWRWERISPIKKSVLRLSGYYLENPKKKSTKFIINEAVNLAKWFGEKNDYRFINAILEKKYLV